MDMVVTCESCGSRFRMRMALMKEAKAARLRCRRCGGYIVVRVPEESQAPPAAEAAAPAQEPVSSSPEETAAPEPLVAIDLTPSAPHAFPAGEPEAALPGTDTRQQLDDLFAFPPGEDAGPERKAPSLRSPSIPALLILSVLWVFLLAAGALYFGTKKSGKELLGQMFAGWGSGRTGSALERPVYDIRDVKWYVDKSSAGGNLFVIKGSVANVGKVPSAGIRIQATLQGKDNESLAEQAAFAGNLLDETLLPQMSRIKIEEFLRMRYGEGNANREIPKGKSLPFMVVFTDSPGQVESIMVTAIDVE